MHLWINFYLERPLFEEGQLGALEVLLHSHLTNWSKQLVAAADEDSPGAAVNGQRSLFKAVHEAAPPRKYGLGDAVLTGAYGGLSLFLDSSRKAFPPESNGFSVEIVDIDSVEGVPAATWAWDFFRDVPKRFAVRYGNARASEEFNKKNLDTAGGGARAIGVNLQESLPGLYWLNFFGAPYVALLGKERLLSAQAHSVEEIGTGVLIGLDADPSAWQTQSYREREKHILERLGRKYFFLRQEPDAATTGPDFLAK